jgi:predicted DNA binding CopG/RHH family protein
MGAERNIIPRKRRREMEAMACAAMTDERAKISLRIPKRDLVRLKSRALQEGIPYQTLINALIHRYVWDRKMAVETRNGATRAADLAAKSRFSRWTARSGRRIGTSAMRVSIGGTRRKRDLLIWVKTENSLA